jgi:hypothetical protein
MMVLRRHSPIIHPMEALLAFYKKTWWLWLIFVIVFVVLAIKVSGLLWIGVPGVIFYSAYFGSVRGQEEQDARR